MSKPTGRPKGSGVVPALLRFLPKVRVTLGGCWLWLAATQSTKWGEYGAFWDGEKLQRAHRVAYKLFRGELPDDLHLDHTCRNTLCVNPWHLEAVTKKVNTLRGMSPAALHARQTHCFRGHPFDVANTYWAKGRHGPQRQCRVCRALYQQQLRRRCA